MERRLKEKGERLKEKGERGLG